LTTDLKPYYFISFKRPLIK